MTNTHNVMHIQSHPLKNQSRVHDNNTPKYDKHTEPLAHDQHTAKRIRQSIIRCFNSPVCDQLEPRRGTEPQEGYL